MKNLNVLVTSGGTVCKIDDVRRITNFSGGMTGALIAEEFVEKHHSVLYFHSLTAARPFRRGFNLDPMKDFEEELIRLRNNYERFKKNEKSFEEIGFLTFRDYHDSLRDILGSRKIDVVVLAAAVSDYGLDKRVGKISSDKDELVMRMSRNEKVISKIKKWNPHVYQIGFKLLMNVRDEELVDVAYNHGKKNCSDLTVANSLNVGDFMKSRTVLIGPEKEVYWTDRKRLAKDLYYILGERFGR